MSPKPVFLVLSLATFALFACGDELADETDSASETGESGDGDGDSAEGDSDSAEGDSAEGDGDGDGDHDSDEGDGDGDEGPPPNPLPDAPAGEWTYLELEGMMCRDGSPAGIVVRYAENSDLLGIYFQGGGACFNELSCLMNPSSVDAGQFNPGPNGGLFDAANPDNPLMDYNWIYFPYCTGDAFIGNQPNGNVPAGPQGQMFVGQPNIQIALERVVDTFPNLADVFLTGESGGGFGAASNYDFISAYFPDNDLTLVDDSGPIFRDEYLAPCLQQVWRDVWNLDATLPQDCADCFNADGGGLSNYWTHVANKYPNANKGLISSHEDAVISLFFGFGTNDCNVLFPSFPNFEEALYDLRDSRLMTPEFGTYFKTGDTHTYLSKSSYYTLEVDGVLLSDWVGDLIAGEPSHVAP